MVGSIDDSRISECNSQIADGKHHSLSGNSAFYIFCWPLMLTAGSTSLLLVYILVQYYFMSLF